MDIEIDPLSPIPIYQQIHDRVVEGIARGEARPGDRLQSVRALATAFGVNPATVSKAYDLLRSESFVVTTPKSGTVIAYPRDWDATQVWDAHLRTVLAEARAHGMTDEEVRTAVEHALDTLSPVGRL